MRPRDLPVLRLVLLAVLGLSACLLWPVGVSSRGDAPRVPDRQLLLEKAAPVATPGVLPSAPARSALVSAGVGPAHSGGLGPTAEALLLHDRLLPPVQEPAHSGGLWPTLVAMLDRPALQNTAVVQATVRALNGAEPRLLYRSARQVIGRLSFRTGTGRSTQSCSAITSGRSPGESPADAEVVCGGVAFTVAMSLLLPMIKRS